MDKISFANVSAVPLYYGIFSILKVSAGLQSTHVLERETDNLLCMTASFIGMIVGLLEPFTAALRTNK
jgi:hypothetical protein